MTAKKTAPKAGAKTAATTETKADLLARYECDGFKFPDRDYYDRHVVFDHVVRMEDATQRERFEAVAHTLRDLLTQQRLSTAATYDRTNPKQVYYLSMEFLIGRSLLNNITNLGVDEFVRDGKSLFESHGAMSPPTG